MKKLVLTLIVATTVIFNSMAQNPTLDIYTEKTQLFSEIYDTDVQDFKDVDHPGGNKALSTEVTTNSPYEGTKHYEIDYNIVKWWAGSGAFNINNWSIHDKVDLTKYTHLKIAYKSTGTAPNKLVFTMTDSTVISLDANNNNKPIYATGTEVAVATSSANYVIGTYPLSSFVGTGDQAINLGNIQSINWFIGPGPGIETAAGKFYIDAIQFVDIQAAPTITAINKSAGHVGDTIIIHGTNLAGVTNAKFNTTSNARIISAGNDSLQVVIPTGATDGIISLTSTKGSISSASAFDITVATGIADNYEPMNVSISPNPSSGVFTIKTDETVDAVIVTDYLGNVISNSSDLKIDMTNQADGLYFVTILSNEKRSVKKLVKK